MTDITESGGYVPRIAPGADWLLFALFALPIAIAGAKLLGAPSAFGEFLSLAGLSPTLHRTVENILFVPLGAVVVVVFRLTLGVKVLGLFRPILMAMAFDAVGIPVALSFLAIVLAAVAAVRPSLKPMHTYARVAVLLSLVAALLLVPLMAGKWLDVRWLRDIAFFPVIALCLTCESFSKVLDQEGLAEAARRTIATIVVAAITFALAAFPGTLELFIRFPELLLAQAGFILLVNKYFALRLLERPLPADRPALGRDP